MFNSTFVTNKKLCQQIDLLTTHSGRPISVPRVDPGVDAPGVRFDVVVTPNEVNDKHGTGALVRRIFDGCDNIFSIRSRNDYGGNHNFGKVSLCLSLQALSRAEAFQYVLYALEGRQVERVVCVPYLAQDLVLSIALKETFNIPLCAYIMDDQNICTNRIPDDLMQEFLLRLTTHPEMRNAYESKYGLKFWLLPAVVPKRLIVSAAQVPQGASHQSKTGALVGSLWSEKWFERLRDTLQGSGCKTHWYGNHKPYFKIAPEDLEAAGITPFGIVPEDQLARLLKTHPFAVVPTGTVEDAGNDLALAKLSLPGRILFILATSNTPVVVLGSKETSASRFVERFGIGTTADYTPESFANAVLRVTDPETQLTMRENAARMAASLSDDGIGEWLWKSLGKGEPEDDRFESVLPRSQDDLVAFIEPPVPKDIYREYIPIYQVMRRLKLKGFLPDFVVDVGASTGIWSNSVSRLFPDARYILVDALASKYDPNARDYLIKDIAQAEVIEVALSNQSGQASFQVSPDLYGASLLRPADFREYESVQVKVKTLDELARERKIQGRGILKIDVQCAEHLVLEGGKNFLDQVDGIVVELSLPRFHANAKTFPEMQQLINRLGFRYYDDAGCWRSPVDGTLLQKDVFFLREDLYAPAMSKR